jgi:beta-glucosidase
MLAALAAISLSVPVYLDPSRPVVERVEDLLGRMTLAEKVGQLQQLDGRNDLLYEFPQQEPGSVLSTLLNISAAAIDLAAQTRLRIPVLLGIDAIHGHGFFPGGTVFPEQLGIAASWDEEIVEMMGNVTAFEMRYTGSHWTFAPVLCVARDPRWGRVGETFGEDGFLIGRFASAMIRGLQGPDVSDDPDKVLACAKHYAGYSETQGGWDASEASLSQMKMRSWFLPPVEKVAIDTNVGTFMVSYQSIDGLPASANRWLQQNHDSLPFDPHIIGEIYRLLFAGVMLK